MHYNWPWLTKPFSYLITLKNREHHVKCKTIFPHRNGYYTLELVSPLITLLNIDSNPPIGSGVRGKQHFWNRETFSLASFRTLPCGNNQFYVVYNRHMFDGFQYLCSPSTRRVSIYVFPLLSKLVHIWAPFHKDSSKLGVFFWCIMAPPKYGHVDLSRMLQWFASMIFLATGAAREHILLPPRQYVLCFCLLYISPGGWFYILPTANQIWFAGRPLTPSLMDHGGVTLTT